MRTTKVKKVFSALLIASVFTLIGFLGGCKDTEYITLVDTVYINDTTTINDTIIINDTVYVNANLTGTKWKLMGTVDVQTGELTVLEPQDCDYCYTLEFTTEGVSPDDNVFVGRAVNNSIFGLYDIDYNTRTFRITAVYSTALPESGDEILYIQILYKIRKFTVTNTYLHLYYNDGNNYLKYYKTESQNEN